MNNFDPTPMIMLMNSSSSNPECPNCHKPEKKKEVCAHCGYEYKEEEEELTAKDIMLGIVIITLLIIILICALFTIFDWIEGTPLSKAIVKTFNFIWKTLTNI